MRLSPRPYAVAFLETVPKGYDVDGFLSAASDLVGAFGSDGRLRAFFGSPAIPVPVKRKVMAEMAGKAGLDEPGRRLFDVVLQHRRILQAGEILHALREEWDRRCGVIQADVKVASPVSGAEQQAIEEAVATRVGMKVRARVEVDPALVAGFVARVGSSVFDASAAHALDRFRREAREKAAQAKA